MLLSARASRLSSVSAYLATALLAANATRGTHGFSLSGLAYFLSLFTNWGTYDLRRPEQGFELTQLRRSLQHLAASGLATQQRPRGVGARGRAGPTYALNDAGIAALALEITERVPRQSAEEALFVAAFVDSYADAIVGSLRSKKKPAFTLSPLRILDTAIAHARRVIADLEKRIREGRALAAEMAVGLSRSGGTVTDALIARFDRPGSYQLHHVRSFGEVLRSLPASMQLAEFQSGAPRRVQFLFEPLLLRARAEEQALLDVAARYAGARDRKD